MTAISFRFLAGRYHATPWGRHVNEGAVEWPPSPWRILRALVAVWKRALPDMGQEEVEPVLRALAAPPEFVLPAASTGHTRHWMPWFKKGPEDRTLVFDAFAVVPRDALLLVHWPDASLGDTQRQTLARILANLGTLGRSESWCEARLLGEDEAKQHLAQPAGHIAAPLGDRRVSPECEIIRLLCADPTDAFADTVTTKVGGRGRARRTIEERSTIYDPPWNLCVETLQLDRERWSDPPGSRWVRYTRPRDCFKVEPVARSRRRRRDEPRPQAARFALDSAVLPLVTDTLPVAEAARRTLVSLYGQLTERGGVRGRSAVLAGKDEHGHPLTDRIHSHAYYLPSDEDGDGRLDHLTVFARDGLGPVERQAMDRLRELRTGRGEKQRHPLRVLLLGFGTLDEQVSGPLCASRVWISATPYIAARYAKTRGRERVDLSSPQARAGFLMADLRGQLAASFPDLASGAAAVQIDPLLVDDAFKVAGRWRPIQFKRFRSKPGDDGGRRLAGAFRIEFGREVGGPIALGHSAHFGMGLFAAESASASDAAEAVVQDEPALGQQT